MLRDLMRRYLRKRPLVRRSHLPNARKHQEWGSILSVDQREREPRHSSRTKSWESCLLHLISRTHSATAHSQNQGRRQLLLQGDQLYSHRCWKQSPGCKGQSCSAYGERRKNVTDYLNSSSMDRYGVWATDAEIISTANLLGCDINVYCKMGEKLNWQRFPSQFTLTQSTDACLNMDSSSGDPYDVILSVQW